MTNKTLSQLADEYSENIENINRQIEACRTELQLLQKAHRNIAAAAVSRKLTVLYSQRNELAETENYLRTYYDKELRCAV